MRKPATAVLLAALALPAMAILPASAATASNASPASPAVAAAAPPQPLGGGGGWQLVHDDSASTIYNTYTNLSGAGQTFCDKAGTVGYNGTAVTFTTDGSANGNCARMASPWTISPTSASPTVWIEYEATLPPDTWAALWAVGDPGPWPNTGEIDTAEELGVQKECHTYHYGTAPPGSSLGSGLPGHCETSSPGGEHIYGVEWSAGSLTFYIDGIQVAHYSSSAINTDPEQIMLDNKTGNFDTAPGPKDTMDVYYVRAWVFPGFLVNGGQQAAYYNLQADSGSSAYFDSASLWRSASKYTQVNWDCMNQGCTQIEVQRNGTGDCMQWVSGTGINDASCTGVQRQTWVLEACPGAGHYEFYNLWASNDNQSGTFLTAPAVGNNLFLGPGKCNANELWAFYPGS